jgi:hypothetical protein
MLPLARKGTCRSPMLIHETLLVSGASVVGMTSREGQGQRCLPADVPGISTVLSQEDRLCPEGRPHQQPAGNSTEESQSRRRRQDPPAVATPKVAWPRQDQQSRGTGMTQATSELHHPASRSLLHERIRGKREGICLQDAGPRGERYFTKLPPSDKGSGARGSRRRCSHGGASSQAAGHLTCNQTPAYIKGSGPLD